jgi:hypothetical protein
MYERNFRHLRDRYSLAGKNVYSRIKRRGVPAQELRAQAVMALEWFRVCLRHGWLGSHRRQNGDTIRTVSGLDALKSVLESRRGRCLNFPYGPAAERAGLAKTRGHPPPPSPGDASPDDRPS